MSETSATYPPCPVCGGHVEDYMTLHEPRPHPGGDDRRIRVEPCRHEFGGEIMFAWLHTFGAR